MSVDKCTIENDTKEESEHVCNCNGACGKGECVNCGDFKITDEPREEIPGLKAYGFVLPGDDLKEILSQIFGTAPKKEEPEIPEVHPLFKKVCTAAACSTILNDIVDGINELRELVIGDGEFEERKDELLNKAFDNLDTYNKEILDPFATLLIDELNEMARKAEADE